MPITLLSLLSKYRKQVAVGLAVLALSIGLVLGARSFAAYMHHRGVESRNAEITKLKEDARASEDKANFLRGKVATLETEVAVLKRSKAELHEERIRTQVNLEAISDPDARKELTLSRAELVLDDLLIPKLEDALDASKQESAALRAANGDYKLVIEKQDLTIREGQEENAALEKSRNRWRLTAGGLAIALTALLL